MSFEICDDGPPDLTNWTMEKLEGYEVRITECRETLEWEINKDIALGNSFSDKLIKFTILEGELTAVELEKMCHQKDRYDKMGANGKTGIEQLRENVKIARERAKVGAEHVEGAMATYEEEGKTMESLSQLFETLVVKVKETHKKT